MGAPNELAACRTHTHTSNACAFAFVWMRLFRFALDAVGNIQRHSHRFVAEEFEIEMASRNVISVHSIMQKCSIKIASKMGPMLGLKRGVYNASLQSINHYKKCIKTTLEVYVFDRSGPKKWI